MKSVNYGYLNFLKKCPLCSTRVEKRFLKKGAISNTRKSLFSKIIYYMAVAYAKKGKTLKKNGEKRMARTDGQECLCFPLKRKKKE